MCANCKGNTNEKTNNRDQEREILQITLNVLAGIKLPAALIGPNIPPDVAGAIGQDLSGAMGNIAAVIRMIDADEEIEKAAAKPAAEGEAWEEETDE